MKYIVEVSVRKLTGVKYVGGELRNVCRALLFRRFRTVIVLDFKVVNILKNIEDASIFNVFPRFTERTLPRVLPV